METCQDYIAAEPNAADGGDHFALHLIEVEVPVCALERIASTR